MAAVKGLSAPKRGRGASALDTPKVTLNGRPETNFQLEENESAAGSSVPSLVASYCRQGRATKSRSACDITSGGKMNLKQIAALWLGVTALLPASAVWAATVDISTHDIGGQVIGSNGPEAGVWAIAET